MSLATIFILQLALGYIPWLFCFVTYFWPKLREMDRAEAQRAIAVLHAFRFFGLVFIIPGVVGSGLPGGFAKFAAYGDFATGLLAILALSVMKVRPLFWSLVVAFNAVGAADILVDYFHGIQLHLPESAGQLGAAYVIPIIYVPILMITHIAAFRLLLDNRPATARALGGVAD